MRFVLFDRIVELKKGQGAVLLKNVTQSEDYFTDHFPEFPVVPGSIILGSFEQGAEILLGVSCDFTLCPILKSLSRASFRHFVLPGDQMKILLTVDSTVPTQIKALAEVHGKRVADARLEFIMKSPDGDPKMREACSRLEALYRNLTGSPVGKVWEVWERQK